MISNLLFLLLVVVCCDCHFNTTCSYSKHRLLFPSTSDNKDDDEGLQRVCGSWHKFQALTDLLEFSLSEVAEWLPRKKFSSFTGSEMTSLIKALFDDSPRRQTILASILEMSS